MSCGAVRGTVVRKIIAHVPLELVPKQPQAPPAGEPAPGADAPPAAPEGEGAPEGAAPPPPAKRARVAPAPGAEAPAAEGSQTSTSSAPKPGRKGSAPGAGARGVQRTLSSFLDEPE